MFIGERLKNARLAAGYSLRDLAEKAENISHTAIAKYEKDEDVPSTGVLDRLATALDVEMEYFFRKHSIKLSKPSYRKKYCLSKRNEERIIASIMDWLERYIATENLFPKQISRKFIYPNIDTYIERLDDIERVATSLRHFWELGLGPIENLTELLEDKGIKVGIIEGMDEFDACTLEEESTGPVIVVKSDIPGDRQRFNLAHELGHIILRFKAELDEEAAAHRFAGAFLVPQETARRELGSERTNISIFELRTLKIKYGFSMQAWIVRAKDLNIISAAETSRIFRWFSVNKFRKEEPCEPIPFEKPQRMDRLVFRALAEQMITTRRASELLKRSVEEIWEEFDERCFKSTSDTAGLKRCNIS